jgi:hypothetical protein
VTACSDLAFAPTSRIFGLGVSLGVVLEIVRSPFVSRVAEAS